MESHLNQLIKTQDKSANKLFPKLSRPVSGNINEEEVHNEETKESIYQDQSKMRLDSRIEDSRDERNGSGAFMQCGTEYDMDFPVQETLGGEDAM